MISRETTTLRICDVGYRLSRTSQGGDLLTKAGTTILYYLGSKQSSLYALPSCDCSSEQSINSRTLILFIYKYIKLFLFRSRSVNFPTDSLIKRFEFTPSTLLPSFIAIFFNILFKSFYFIFFIYNSIISF